MAPKNQKPASGENAPDPQPDALRQPPQETKTLVDETPDIGLMNEDQLRSHLAAARSENARINDTVRRNLTNERELNNKVETLEKLNGSQRETIQTLQETVSELRAGQSPTAESKGENVVPAGSSGDMKLRVYLAVVTGLCARPSTLPQNDQVVAVLASHARGMATHFIQQAHRL